MPTIFCLAYTGIDVIDALWIVILGMAIIFAVLGILLLVMVLLGKFIKSVEKEKP